MAAALDSLERRSKILGDTEGRRVSELVARWLGQRVGESHCLGLRPGSAQVSIV